MPASPARTAAFHVLMRVEAEHAHAADALRLRRDSGMSSEDAGLATQLVFGVLRWQRLLDALYSRHLRGSHALDPEIRIALRMGIYQLRFLERVPVHAAVNESVELAKQAGKTSGAGLVNAVLRKCAAEAGIPAEGIIPAGGPDIERFAILNSHPTWMAERWTARYGRKSAAMLMQANNQPAQQGLAFASLHQAELRPGRQDEIVAEMEADGVTIQPGRLLRDARRAVSGNVEATSPFSRGEISFQDEASQAVPLLMGKQEGMALDLCAAPGGKTAVLARNGGAMVVAGDLHMHRLRAMKKNLSRRKTENICFIALNAEEALPFGGQFGQILLDAPCSGTGTLGRNPEIRWRLDKEDLAVLAARQRRMLRNAIQNLGPGGRLVYSTCSLEAEENEQVVEAALQEKDVASKKVRRMPAAELRELLAPFLAEGFAAESVIGDDGAFRTLPHVHHTDGFFAVALKRGGN